MICKDIYILGVGHNTAVTIELAEACGYRVAGLYHYAPGRSGEVFCGIKILGTHDDILNTPSLKGTNFALSMGDNDIRANLFNKIKEKDGQIPTLIHPTCTVSRFSTIGEGTQLEAGCTVHANALIKENCNIQPHVLVCHNSIIQEHSFIAAKTVIGAYITVEHHAFIGMGAILISSKVHKIGHSATIGAGAVVTKDLPANCTAVGLPAKQIK